MTDKLWDAWSSFWLKPSCGVMLEFRNTKVLPEPLWREAIQFHNLEWEEFGFSGSWKQQSCWSYEWKLEQRQPAWASKGKASRVSQKPCAWVEWVAELRTLITTNICIPETVRASSFFLDRQSRISLAFRRLNSLGSVTSTAIIVELFLTLELPQPRVAGLRGPGEREEKVGQSESIGPSAHYCPPARPLQPNHQRIFFSLQNRQESIIFFVHPNLESDNVGCQHSVSPLIPGTLKCLHCNPLIFTVWTDFLEGSVNSPVLLDHGRRRRALWRCLRAVRGHWQVSVTVWLLW